MGERRKPRSEQADSDPLPYVQVDRAVRGRVGLLAGALGVTPQHALGALVEWWDLNGDPRALTEILEATPAGAEPAVIVTADAARERFALAAGKACEPSTLVHLGLLEPVGDGFRVRGMSRYFAPVAARLKARAGASVAGRASAEARRQATGSAQPVREPVRGAVREPFGDRSGAVRESLEQPPNGARTPPNPIGQRSAVSGHLLVEDPAPPSRRGASKPKQPDLLEAPPDPRHAPLIADLVAAFEQTRGARYPFNGRDAKAVQALLATGNEPADLVAAWRRALVSSFPKVSTLSEFHASLAHFVGAGTGGSKDWRAGVDHAKSWGVE